MPGFVRASKVIEAVVRREGQSSMERKTAFYTHERTFWYSTGVQSLFMPIGGWVEPPEGTYGADTPASKRRFLNLLKASSLAEHLAFPTVESATEQDLLRVHTTNYLQDFKQLSDKVGGDLGDLAPFSPGTYEIAKLSAGLAIHAVSEVLDGRSANGYALCRPSGHHCLPGRPMGFALLANIALAIKAAQAKHPIERIAVVDWDVHHGNETQAIFYEDPNVLTISIHQHRCLVPGQKLEDSLSQARGEGKARGSNVNIPLPPGSGHDAYISAMEIIVLPKLEEFRPELLIVAGGLDANAVDPLARMLLHSDSYRQITKTMMEAADGLCKGRLVMVHEGGYSEAYVPFCGLAIMEELSERKSDVVDPMLEFLKGWQPGEQHRVFTQDVLRNVQDELGR